MRARRECGRDGGGSGRGCGERERADRERYGPGDRVSPRGGGGGERRDGGEAVATGGGLAAERPVEREEDHEEDAERRRRWRCDVERVRSGADEMVGAAAPCDALLAGVRVGQ